MQKTGKSLIISIVNKGYSEELMNAARSAGASGGTIMHARGTGSAEAEKIFGITIEPEKELVMILTKDESRQDIMKAIYSAAGLATRGKGIAFSLPVDDVLGTPFDGMTFADKE